MLVESLGTDGMNQSGSVRSSTGCRYTAVVPVLLAGAYRSYVYEEELLLYTSTTAAQVYSSSLQLSHAWKSAYYVVRTVSSRRFTFQVCICIDFYDTQRCRLLGYSMGSPTRNT